MILMELIVVKIPATTPGAPLEVMGLVPVRWPLRSCRQTIVEKLKHVYTQ